MSNVFTIMIVLYLCSVNLVTMDGRMTRSSREFTYSINLSDVIEYIKYSNHLYGITVILIFT